MNLQFKPVEAEDIRKIAPFYALRPNRTCDSVYLDSFIWRDYYHENVIIRDLDTGRVKEKYSGYLCKLPNGVYWNI